MWSVLKEVEKYRWGNMSYLWVRMDIVGTQNVIVYMLQP